MRKYLASLVLVALGVSVAAQELPTRLGGTNGPRPAAAAPAPRAVPRLPDGTVDFNGVWSGGGPVGDIGAQGGLKPGYLESIMTPWAKALFATRTEAQDPYNYCMPAGVPRMAADFAWRLVQYPTTKPTHIFLLYEGEHAQLPADLHGRPASIRRIPRRRGSDTRSDDGTAIRSSSTRSASTTSSGSIAAARRTPSSCTRSNGGRGRSSRS